MGKISEELRAKADVQETYAKAGPEGYAGGSQKGVYRGLAQAYREAAALIEPVEARTLPEGWEPMRLHNPAVGRVYRIANPWESWGWATPSREHEKDSPCDTWQEAIAAAELSQPTPETDGEEEHSE